MKEVTIKLAFDEIEFVAEFIPAPGAEQAKASEFGVAINKVNEAIIEAIGKLLNSFVPPAEWNKLSDDEKITISDNILLRDLCHLMKGGASE